MLRRLVPPKNLLGDEAAMRAEVGALKRCLNQRAPSRGWAEWWEKFEDELLSRMKTRAYPIVADLEAAAAEVARRSRQSHAPNGDLIEGAAVDRMESWFRQFKSQMPSHGRATRTAALIERGVLHSERQARFYGFTLSDEQRRKSDDQTPCREEEKHHQRVMDDLHFISRQAAAHRDDVARARATVKPADYAA